MLFSFHDGHLLGIDDALQKGMRGAPTGVQFITPLVWSGFGIGLKKVNPIAECLFIAASNWNFLIDVFEG
jgi:hypothetical protein